MKLTALAPAKVNLCLFLGPPRPDGRHEVVTLLESVSLADELSLTTRDDAGRDELHCPGVEGPNLVATALSELRAGGWDAPPVRIEVRKRIPVAGGMGGGSVDAAAALRLADALKPVPGELIAELAGRLGTDVPSQLQPGLVIGTGAGDEVQPMGPLGTHALLILPLPHRLGAAEVYAEADRLGLPRSRTELERASGELRDALGAGEELAPHLLVNDLQPAAISLCPPIGEAVDAARGAGAGQVMVSGSGPTVFGLLWGQDALERARARRGLPRRTLSWRNVRVQRRLPFRPSLGCGTIRRRTMSNTTITYLVGACLGVFGLTAFCALVLAPAISAYRRPLERAAVVVLSLYVLAALVGAGIVVGGLVVLEWPRLF